MNYKPSPELMAFLQVIKEKAEFGPPPKGATGYSVSYTQEEIDKGKNNEH